MVKAHQLVECFYEFCAEHGAYAGYKLLATILDGILEDLIIEHDDDLKEAFKQGLKVRST